jgi:hypothetical protein
MGGKAFPGSAHAATAPAPSPRATAPLTRAALEQMLAQRERELLAGPALALDLERLGRFVRTVGAMHAALSQQEERYPSSRTVCLRWSVRGALGADRLRVAAQHLFLEQPPPAIARLEPPGKDRRLLPHFRALRSLSLLELRVQSRR